jgi:hypothetical protein
MCRCCVRRLLHAALSAWQHQVAHKAVARHAADTLFARITAMLASETASAVFAAWRAHTGRMRGLRLVLLKGLGRTMALAFAGWR